MSDAYIAKLSQPAMRLFCWSVAWGLSILMTYISARFFHLPKMLFVVALIVNVGIGVGAIGAHIRWLKALDEMQRKIQLEAMGWALGILWIAFGALLIMDAADLAYVNPGVFPVLAALGMAAGTIRGFIKYK